MIVLKRYVTATMKIFFGISIERTTIQCGQTRQTEFYSGNLRYFICCLIDIFLLLNLTMTFLKQHMEYILKLNWQTFFLTLEIVQLA